MRYILRCATLILGLLCLMASAILFYKNQQEEGQAQTASTSVTQILQQSIQTHIQSPDGEELTTEVSPSIDGTQYIGILSFPLLSLELPIASVYSDEQLKLTPCVYTGSLTQDDLVISAHNYTAHFGTINQLQVGDEVILLDISGVSHSYTVTLLETIDGDDVDGLYAGEWDLALFTCLYRDNSQRTVVKCDRTDSTSHS